MPFGSRAWHSDLFNPLFIVSQRREEFVYKLVVQFNLRVTEVILINGGVGGQRRQELVGMLMTAIGMGGNEEGLDGAVKKFHAHTLRGRTDGRRT